MQNDLLVQYGAIRETIRTNIDTIGRLLSQAENLKNIVDNVNDSDIKDSLQNEVEKIQNTVGELIVQTDRLFDKYSEFVKSVFNK